MKWHKVEDVLPDSTKHVILRIKFDSTPLQIGNVLFVNHEKEYGFSEGFLADDKWFVLEYSMDEADCYGCFIGKDKEVTHWAELPSGDEFK